MISPERLRLYTFFSSFSSDELNAVSMMAREADYAKGTVIFQAETPAKTLYLLVKGCVELYYESFDPMFKPELRRQFLIGEINSGEIFGISALVEPYQMTASAVAATPSQIIEIDAEKLRTLAEQFPDLECALSKQALQTLTERLHYTRIQLAAAITQ